MTSNLINSLCLFSPALLTVTRDEQQNKQAGQSQPMVEQEKPIRNSKHPSIYWEGGEGRLWPVDTDTVPSLCAHQTFIHVVLLTTSLWVEWAQAELTSQTESDSNPYLVLSSFVKYCHLFSD